MMRREQEDQQSRAFYELSALVLNLLRSPPASLNFSDQAATMVPVPPPSGRRSPAPAQITPAGFASLLLGISLALMLCGSVTFFIGFMLMPWVLGLVMVFTSPESFPASLFWGVPFFVTPLHLQRHPKMFLRGSLCRETNGEIEEFGAGLCTSSYNLGRE